jgi:hypothetical protein
MQFFGLTTVMDEAPGATGKRSCDAEGLCQSGLHYSRGAGDGSGSAKDTTSASRMPASTIVGFVAATRLEYAPSYFISHNQASEQRRASDGGGQIAMSSDLRAG